MFLLQRHLLLTVETMNLDVDVYAHYTVGATAKCKYPNQDNVVCAALWCVEGDSKISLV